MEKDLLINDDENINIDSDQDLETNLIYEDFTNTINIYDSSINNLENSVSSLETKIDTVQESVYSQYSTLTLEQERTNYLYEFSIVQSFIITLLLIILVFRGVKK